ADFVAFLETCVVAEDDHPDFGFLEAERETGDAVTEIEHFVQHHVAETLDAGDAVADFANHADAALDRRRFRADDLLFNLLKQTGHGWTFRLEPRLERGETAFDATVINIAADGDAHAADE